MWSPRLRKVITFLKVFTFLVSFAIAWYAYYYFALTFVEPVSRLYSSISIAFATAVIVYLLALYLSRKFLEATLYPKTPSFWEEVRKLRGVRGFKIAFILLIIVSIVVGFTAPYEVAFRRSFLIKNEAGTLDYMQVIFYVHESHYDVHVAIDSPSPYAVDMEPMEEKVPFFWGVFDRKIVVEFYNLTGDASVTVEGKQVCCIASYVPVFWRAYNVRMGDKTDSGSVNVVLTIIGPRLVERQGTEINVRIITQDIDRLASLSNAFQWKESWSDAFFRLFHGDVRTIKPEPEVYTSWVLSLPPTIEAFVWWASDQIVLLSNAIMAQSYAFMDQYGVIVLDIRFKILILVGLWIVALLAVYLLRK